MSLDLDVLRAAVATHGTVLRVVVAATRGSVPREAGAAMLLWPGGQSGTIGGGALEWRAAQAARHGQRGVSHHPLGPALGQCCGGAVTLWTEAWDAAALDGVAGDVHARGPGSTPLAVTRHLAALRSGRIHPAPALVGDWFVEPVDGPARPVWIWGAGHVGRALVSVLAPVPDVAITWVDTAAERFPGAVPDGVAPLIAADPVHVVAHAPDTAEHLVLTYSHEIDLALCHALLSHQAAGIALIGSATKWARFRSRLQALGHGDAEIARIVCPIGDPALGKHPQAIALGVAAALLRPRDRRRERESA